MSSPHFSLIPQFLQYLQWRSPVNLGQDNPLTRQVDNWIGRFNVRRSARQGWGLEVAEVVSIRAQDDEDHREQSGFGIVTQERTRTKRPSMYQVLLLNDDYTPMEYVVNILQSFFDKDHAEATRIMLKVHNEGRAVVGSYTYEIAETKVVLVTEDARKNGYPLQCTMEKV